MPSGAVDGSSVHVEVDKKQPHATGVCALVLEQMERRQLLSFADGNGPVVTAVTETPGSNQLVITFDGPLNPGPAEDVANYQVTKALANPELVTSERAAGENPLGELQRYAPPHRSP